MMENMDWKMALKALTALEFILSTIIWTYGFFVVKNPYFSGVGIGLLIAWVTGAIAYLRLRSKGK